MSNEGILLSITMNVKVVSKTIVKEKENGYIISNNYQNEARGCLGIGYY